MTGEPAGVTVEEFNKMTEAEAFTLMACQIDKYKVQVGTKEAREYLLRVTTIAWLVRAKEEPPLATGGAQEGSQWP